MEKRRKFCSPLFKNVFETEVQKSKKEMLVEPS